MLPHRYVQPGWGVAVAVEMGDSYLGVAHALLAMIRDRETVPARALADLADLDALDAAVVEAMNAPVRPHEDAVFLPEGQQLDSPLSTAIIGALPEGTTFGFNGRAETGETWIHVFGPGGSLGREVSREVLNAALVNLGRPGLGS
jgi:Clp amino terminal domain, pathogenicity island component